MRMKSKSQILNSFIKKFLRKSENGTSEELGSTTREINKLFKRFSNKPVQFEEKEIVNALGLRGYEVTNNADEVHPIHGKIDPSSIRTFIQVDIRSLKDLKSARMQKFRAGWNEDTVKRLNSLKSDLETFFNKATEEKIRTK